MNRFAVAFAVLALVAPTAWAHGNLNLHGHGGPGLGLGLLPHDGLHGPFGGDHGLGPFGLGLWGGNTEQLQTHFENKFDHLVTHYDTGLAEIPDFYNSEQYTNILGGVERLIGRYDLFLSGVDRKIDLLGNLIGFANDGLTHVTDLIAEYEARTDLPPQRLEHILARLTRVQGGLETKIDRLTEKQTSLNDNLPTYQTFSDSLAAYLAEITAAPGGGADPLTEVPLVSSPAGVPEPTSVVLLAVAAVGLLMMRRAYRPRAFALVHTSIQHQRSETARR